MLKIIRENISGVVKNEYRDFLRLNTGSTSHLSIYLLEHKLDCFILEELDLTSYNRMNTKSTLVIRCFNYFIFRMDFLLSISFLPYTVSISEWSISCPLCWSYFFLFFSSCTSIYCLNVCG